MFIFETLSEASLKNAFSSIIFFFLWKQYFAVSVAGFVDAQWYKLVRLLSNHMDSCGDALSKRCLHEFHM